MTNTSVTTEPPAQAEPMSTGHEHWMRRALHLAAQGRGWTSPNPMVGSVVVRDGVAVGEGYHRQAGLDHAEAAALSNAGDAARGADLYVTLEPCSHYGRTPPCTGRIIASGVARVICAHPDPDPRVNGRGIQILRDAGIEVIVGPCAEEARRLNEHYLHWKQTGRPWITAKWAQTLDGQVASSTGSSKWITGTTARTEAHRQRSFHDAVIVGIGTVLMDDPELSVRHVEGHQPWHVVLDARLQTPPRAKLIVPGRTLLVGGDDVSPNTVSMWRDAGVDVETVPLVDGRLNLEDTIRLLARRGFISALVEGGPRVITSFLKAGLVQRVIAFIAPKIVGTGYASVGSLSVTDIGNALQLSKVEMTGYGTDWCMTGLLTPNNTGAAEE
jgi:diaminohydroxyphosphoribosylaminopyrimidine deaminase / 5-amino-6-(5-phosphoribosylamino)uracil reductase